MMQIKRLVLVSVFLCSVVMVTGCSFPRSKKQSSTGSTEYSSQHKELSSNADRGSAENQPEGKGGMLRVPSGGRSWQRMTSTQPQSVQVNLLRHNVIMSTREDQTYFTTDTRYSSDDLLRMLTCSFERGDLSLSVSYVTADPACTSTISPLEGERKSGERRLNHITLRADEEVILKDGVGLQDELVLQGVRLEEAGNDLVLIPTEEVGYVLLATDENRRYANTIAGSYESFDFGYSPRGETSATVLSIRQGPGLRQARLLAGQSSHLVYGDTASETFANTLRYTQRSVLPRDKLPFLAPPQHLLTDVPYQMEREMIAGYELETIGMRWAGGESPLSFQQRKETVGVFTENGGGYFDGIDELSQVALTTTDEDNQTRSLLSFSSPGTYLIVGRDSAGFRYVRRMEVKERLEVFQRDNPDMLEVEVSFSAAGITQEHFQKKIDETFGTGFIDVRRSYRMNEAYINYYTYDIPESQQVSNSFILSYKPVPGERYQGVVSLESFVGRSVSLSLDLSVAELPAYVTSLNVYDKSLNLLPEQGRRGNQLKVRFTNIQNPLLEMQECELGSPGSGRLGYAAESQIISCQGEVVTVPVVGSGSWEWRRQHEAIVSFPDDLSDASVIRVSYTYNRDAYEPTVLYFVRSSVGVFAKIDTNQQVHVWGRDLETGERVRNGEVVLYDKELKEFARTPVGQQGGAVLSLRESAGDGVVVKIEAGDRSGWLMLNASGDPSMQFEEYTWLYFTSYLDPYGLYESPPQNNSSMRATERVYGYTDRGLYAPGEAILFAGFARDVAYAGTEEALLDGAVTVRLTNVNGETLEISQQRELDEYGGFTGSFLLSDEMPLGVYYITYELFDTVSFTHEIRVEEFQKPTYFADMEVIVDDQLGVMIEPQYYFGGSLSNYEVTVARSLQQAASCRWCWSRDETDSYTNHLFGVVVTTGGSVVQNSVSGQTFLSLVDLKSLPHRGVPLDGRIKATIKDVRTNEIIQSAASVQIQPEVMITLDGQPIEWLYGTGGTAQIAVTASGQYERLVYELLYKPYEYAMEYGVDGNRYTVDNQQLQVVGTGRIAGEQITVRFEKGGEYLLRVLAYDEQGVVAENQKRINRYGGSESWRYGHMDNNFTLHVSVPKGAYRQGERIPIDIEPYVRGSEVVVTVEKGGALLDTYEFVLDGSQVEIPAKETYFPNVHISVIQVVGEQHNIVEGRSEPRFFVGYAEALIDQHLVDLDIRLIPEHETYAPGDTMRVRIETFDDTGTPVDARVSVAVVDKSLTDLYHLIKQPIPDFYYKVAAMVPTRSNMVYLYQMLNVLVQDGQKGGDGSSGLGNRAWRTALENVAYRRGDIITKDGVAYMTAELPDNLTTRMIDAIGITKGGRVGTATATFTVAQAVMLRPYLPAFVSYGDSIEIPVEVIFDDAKPDQSATVRAYLSLPEEKDIRPLGVLSGDENTHRVLLEVPSERRNEKTVEVHLEALSSAGSDRVTYSLPLRAEGFFIHEHGFAFTGLSRFGLVPEIAYLTGVSTLYLQRFPLEAMQSALRHLLVFPYGCAEQRSSALLGALVAQRLATQGVVTEEIMKDGLVHFQDERVPLQTLIQSYITTIWQSQLPDGGITFRSSGEESSYPLSAYVWSLMMMLNEAGWTPPVEIMEPLEAYLRTFGKEHPLEYTYLQRQFGQYKRSIDTAHLEEILQKDEQLPVHILAFASLAVAGETQRAQELLATLARDEIDFLSQRTFDFYLGEEILKAILLRGLLALDNEETDAQAEKLVLDLLKMRDDQGRRGWSTQSNAQVLLALADYLEYQGETTRSVSCTVDIDGEQKTFTLNDAHLSRETTFPLTTQNVTRSCDAAVLQDQKLSYMPEDKSLIDEQMNNVDLLERNIAPGELGDVLNATGGFVVNREAEHVAVEMFLPSTHTFLATRTALSNDAPFSMRGGEQCLPEHYEVRFDRLFLYYSTLGAGLRCDVDIPVIKGFAGKAWQMPTALREMYQTRVRGRIPGSLPQ